jgi:preprotein translocase subunit SecG
VIYLLYSVHIVVCIFLILVVLLQQGKGADLSVFGGGSTQTAFGARGATTLLHKLTVASFVIFILTTLAIGIPQFSGEGSVMSGAPATGKGTPAGTAARGAKPVPVPGRTAPKPVPTPGQPAAPAPGAAKAPAPAAPAVPAPAPAKPPAPGGKPGTGR